MPGLHQILALALAASAATATPLLSGRPLLARRQEGPDLSNCTSDKEIQPQCYIDLGIHDYINAWVAENGTAANCDTLGFAQCYLTAHGYTGLTCDDITSNTCPPFPTIDPDVYGSAQEFYVLWNIYNVYQVFNTWSLSLFNGHQLAAGTLDDIVNTIAPPTNADTSNSFIATLIAASFFYLTNFLVVIPVAAPTLLAPALLSALIVSNTATSFSLTGSILAKNAGGADTDTRFTQLATLGTDLSTLVVEFQKELATNVKAIQGNHSIFLEMTYQGGLSARIASGTVETSVNLFQDLQAFIVSEALAANGMYSVKSTGVNALKFGPETPGTITCDGLGPAGNCYGNSQFWVDEAAGNTYSLHNPNDWGVNVVPMYDKIYEKGWANLSEILAIESCQGQAPALDVSTLRMTCLASHKLCEWNYPPYPEENWIPYDPGDKQYTNCDNDPHWGYACGSFVAGMQIPPSYIGPAMKHEQERHEWCPYHN